MAKSFIRKINVNKTKLIREHDGGVGGETEQTSLAFCLHEFWADLMNTWRISTQF